jgi:hypothetical protein
VIRRLMRLLILSSRCSRCSHWSCVGSRRRLRNHLRVKMASTLSLLRLCLVEVSIWILSSGRNDIALLSIDQRSFLLHLLSRYNGCHILSSSDSSHVLPVSGTEPPYHAAATAYAADNDYGYCDDDANRHSCGGGPSIADCKCRCWR